MFWKVIPRKAWKARASSKPLQSVNWTSTTATRVHHTVSTAPRGKRFSPWLRAAERAHMRQLQNFHMDSRGWSDIGYNFLIFPSGNVYEGRGKRKLGAHTTGHNSDCGISFVGNFETEKPTAQAIGSFYQLRGKLGIERGLMFPHCRTFSTSCPGKNIRAALKLTC